MREINLPAIPTLDPDTNPVQAIIDRFDRVESTYFQCGLLLSAYMLWPNNETRRNQWMLVNEDLRRLLEEEPVDVDPRLVPFGGLKALSESTRVPLEKDAAKIERKDWIRCAEIFQTLIDIANDPRTSELEGGASLEKAKAMLENEQTADSASAYEKAWQRYKDVAHLIAAAYQLALRVKGALPDNHEGISPHSIVFFAPAAPLAASMTYQQFGLDFVPHARKQSLLDHETVWRIPEEIDVEPAPLFIRKLPGSMVDFLIKEHKAKP